MSWGGGGQWCAQIKGWGRGLQRQQRSLGSTLPTPGDPGEEGFSPQSAEDPAPTARSFPLLFSPARALPSPRRGVCCQAGQAMGSKPAWELWAHLFLLVGQTINLPSVAVSCRHTDAAMNTSDQAPAFVELTSLVRGGREQVHTQGAHLGSRGEESPREHWDRPLRRAIKKG